MVHADERQSIGYGDGFYAGQPSNVFLQLFEKQIDLIAVRIVDGHLHRQKIVCPETRIDLHDAKEALNQQSGSDKKSESQSHFANDQRTAQMLTTSSRAAISVFQRVCEIQS